MRVIKFGSKYEIDEEANIYRIEKGTRIVLSQHFVAGDYKAVHIDRKTTAVHRLMAELFLGKKDGYIVHHIDHDKSNNELSNLEYITQAEHCSHHSHRRTNKKTTGNKQDYSIINVRTSTKLRIIEAKGNMSYDDFIVNLLEN